MLCPIATFFRTIQPYDTGRYPYTIYPITAVNPVVDLNYICHGDGYYRQKYIPALTKISKSGMVCQCK